MLLERVSAFSAQVKGFIDDNPNLNHVLKQLEAVSDLLVKHKYDLVDTLTTVAKFVASLGEAVASGPYFKVLLVNLLPYQILQPFVDCRVQEARHRSGEVLAQRRSAGLPVPRPNGQRFPNGAPAPAPTPLEGTPEHPGPAVPPGSPCSYTPPADGLPTARRPAAVCGPDAGPVRRPRLRPAGRGHVEPEPEWPWLHARRAGRGDPGSDAAGHAAAYPSRCRPHLPVPAPCRWARCPRPPDFTPGIAPLPPALTGPPPPPGPGPDVGPAGRRRCRQPAVPPARVAGG